MLNSLVKNLSKCPRTFRKRIARPFSTLEPTNAWETEDPNWFNEEHTEQQPSIDIDFDFLSIKNISVSDKMKADTVYIQDDNLIGLNSQLKTAIVAENLKGIASCQENFKKFTYSEFQKLVDMKCHNILLSTFTHPQITVSNKIVLLINLNFLQTPQNLCTLIQQMYENSTQRGKEDLQIVYQKLQRTGHEEIDLIKNLILELNNRMFTQNEKTYERLNLLIFLLPSLFNDYLSRLSLEQRQVDRTIFEALRITQDPDLQQKMLTEQTASFIAQNSTADTIDLFVIAVEYLAKSTGVTVKSVILKLTQEMKAGYWQQLLIYDSRVVSSMGVDRKLVLFHLFFLLVKNPLFNEAIAANCVHLLKELDVLNNLTVRVLLKQFLSILC